MIFAMTSFFKSKWCQACSLPSFWRSFTHCLYTIW